jgi:arylsulfatase A-like enzyme
MLRAAAVPLPLLLLLALACSAPDERARANVLLVTLDTTRADRLGVYGHARPTSPNLDALASEAIVFERAYSTSSWTLPAHASLFTGKYPASHGARHDPQGPLVLADAAPAPRSVRARGMSPQEPTLAGLLAGHGWATGAVVGGPWLMRVFGVGAGFDFYDDAGMQSQLGRRATEITENALAWLARTEEPFLLFLNYFDPHAPYAPPPRFARPFLPPGVAPDPLSLRQAPALYDGEIRYTDHELGRLFGWLRERGLWERTLVVVTADHGELLGERGDWGHERWLWEPLVHVPLIVKPAGPGRPGRREAAPVSLVDVLPLVLRELGLPDPPGVQGEAPPAARRELLAEVNPIGTESDTGEWRARWEGSLKFLTSTLGERHLYDLAADPDEARNLVPRDPELAARQALALERAFAALPAPPADAAPVQVDERTRELLRELGYLGPAGEAPRSQTRSDASE